MGIGRISRDNLECGFSPMRSNSYRILGVIDGKPHSAYSATWWLPLPLLEALTFSFPGMSGVLNPPQSIQINLEPSIVHGVPKFSSGRDAYALECVQPPAKRNRPRTCRMAQQSQRRSHVVALPFERLRNRRHAGRSQTRLGSCWAGGPRANVADVRRARVD